MSIFFQHVFHENLASRTRTTARVRRFSWVVVTVHLGAAAGMLACTSQSFNIRGYFSLVHLHRIPCTTSPAGQGFAGRGHVFEISTIERFSAFPKLGSRESSIAHFSIFGQHALSLLTLDHNQPPRETADAFPLCRGEVHLSRTIFRCSPALLVASRARFLGVRGVSIIFKGPRAYQAVSYFLLL